SKTRPSVTLRNVTPRPPRGKPLPAKPAPSIGRAVPGSRRRPHWAVLVIPIGLVTALGIVGTALTAPLAVHHPLLLLVLEARDRNLLLARHVSVIPYVVVGCLRRLCTDPVFYLLGR